MKRLIAIFALSIAALLVPDNLAAQSDAFKRYQNTYTGLEGVSITTISPTLLRMAGGQQSEEFRSMIDKLKGITIIVADDHFDILKTEINRVIKDGEYEVITSVVDGSQTVKVCMRQISRKENELLMINMDKEEFVVVNIVGDMSPDQMLSVGRGMM